MELKELQRLLDSGVTVTVSCKAKIEEPDTCLNEGMRGDIKRADLAIEGDVIRLTIDLARHEKFNDTMMKSYFYDDNGEPCLNAKEADWYPKNNREGVYIDLDGFDKQFDEYFNVIESASALLMSEWAKSGSKDSYVTYLENLITHMRSEIL